MPHTPDRYCEIVRTPAFVATAAGVLDSPEQARALMTDEQRKAVRSAVAAIKQEGCGNL